MDGRRPEGGVDDLNEPEDGLDDELDDGTVADPDGPDDPLGGDGDVDEMSPAELRTSLRETRGRVRSLNALLVGRTHAVNSLENQVGELRRQVEQTPGSQDDWLRRIRTAAGGASPPNRRGSLLRQVGSRLREAFRELGELHHRLKEVEGELAYQRDLAGHAQVWIDQLRRDGRVPDYPPGEIERLNAELDAQGERIGQLEAELQKKSDVIGQLLQKAEGAEDARQEAVSRYKALVKQQERIAAAFQEQTRRVRALKAENENLQAALAGRGVPAGGSGEAPAGLSDAERERLGRAEEEARAARALIQSSQQRLEQAEARLKDARAEAERLRAERDALQAETSNIRRRSLEHQSGSSEMSTRLGVAEARVVELELELQDFQRRRNQGQEERLKAEDRARELGARVQALVTERDELQRRLKDVDGGRAGLEQRVRVAEERLSEVLRELGDAERQVEEERRRREETEAALGRVDERRRTVEAELEEARESRTAAERAQIRLEGRVRDLEKALAQSEEKITSAQRAVTAAEADRDAAHQAQVRAEALLEDEQRRRAAAEASQEEAQSRASAAEATLKAAEGRAAAASHQLAETAAALSHHQAELARVSGELLMLQEQSNTFSYRLRVAESSRAEAEGRAEAAEERSRAATQSAAEANTLAQRARALADDLEARLRGALAHRQTLEERLAAETGAMERLQGLITRVEGIEADRDRARAELEQMSIRRSEAAAEAVTLRHHLDDQILAVGRLQQELDESRQRSLELREDLRKARLGLGELQAERDREREAQLAREREAQRGGTSKAGWEEERIRLEAQIDALHREMAHMRRDLGAEAPARPPRAEANVPLSARFDSPQATPSRYVAEPPAEAPEPPPSRPTLEPRSFSDLAPRPAVLPRGIPVEPPPPPPAPVASPLEPEPEPTDPFARGRRPASIDDWQPREAPVPDEPFAPLSLAGGRERVPTEGAVTTSTRSRTTTSLGNTASQSRPDTRSGPPSRSQGDAWDSLVANRRFRPGMGGNTGEIGAATEAPRPPTGPAPVPNTRPIVDLEGDIQRAPPRRPAEVMPAPGPSAEVLPTEEEVRALLAQGSAAEAFRKARQRWRRETSSAERLKLFLEVARSSAERLMEALAELDERLPPQRVGPEEASVVARSLIAAGLPAEALPYALWSLSHHQTASGSPLLHEGAQALLKLRDRRDGSLRSASLMATFGGLPLPSLGALFFTVEGFTLRAAEGGRARPTDFLVVEAGNARLPGFSLGNGQGVFVRALPALGSRVEPEIFDELDAANTFEGGKHRASFALLPQPPDGAVEREVKRVRKKRGHVIVPLGRAEIIEALLDGKAPALLKDRIRSFS